MNWRNVRQLNERIIASLALLRQHAPQCIVGIPRSGMLAASLAALYLNLPLSDVFSFAKSQAWWRNKPIETTETARILLLDDSLNGGNAMQGAIETIKQTRGLFGLDIVRAAVYGRSTSVEKGNADLILEPVDGERVFEWNLWKHRLLESSVVDIDGVLCRDPTAEENDDGPRYRKFLETVEPLYEPYRTLGWIATTRLEKYRALTEAWLTRHGIRYRGLTMLDLPDAQTRRAKGGRAEFKARVYSQLKAELFIESDHRQAVTIAKLSGKPVIAMSSLEMF